MKLTGNIDNMLGNNLCDYMGKIQNILSLAEVVCTQQLENDWRHFCFAKMLTADIMHLWLGNIMLYHRPEQKH